MYEDKDCIIFEAEKDRVEDHPLEIGDEPGSLHHGPVHKELIHQIMLHEDEDTGMSVSLVRYTKGEPSAVHRHTCGKGEYVLRGTLHTEHGDFGPGTLIWWKPGSLMFHGATMQEDCDVLLITDRPFDIEYMGRMVAPGEAFDPKEEFLR